MPPQIALYAACRDGGFQQVRSLLKAEKKKGRLASIINEAGEDGGTPLSVALKNGHTKVAEILLEKGGADADHYNAVTGCTPLIVASAIDSLFNAQCLVAKGGADMNKPIASNGATPLSICSENNSLRVAQYIIENGAGVNKAANNGATPLTMSSQEGRQEMVNKWSRNS